jgi:hypothetical protein
VVGLGGAQAVDAGHRGHDDDVLAVEEGPGGGVAQAVNGVVDGGVLFNIEIRLGDVGLGLVVVVIADEILHRVIGKELLELAVELGRQGLVGGQHQRRQIHPGNDVGYGEGLTGAGDAQEDLVGLTLAEPVSQGPDSRGLVALGGEVGGEYEAVWHI